jgi:hypothetical protein
MVQQARDEKPGAGTPRQRHEWALARSSRLVRAFIVILVLGPLGDRATAAEAYEQPTERRAAEVLPPAMVVPPNHQVQDPVVADGYMDRFTVVSPFGTFEVTGHGALRKLLNKISAIAALREIKTSKAFGDAAVDTAKGP